MKILLRRWWFVCLWLGLLSVGQAQVPPELVFWSVLTEPTLVERQKAILAQFTAQTGIPVQLVVMDANFMDYTLPVVAQNGVFPDLILHPVSRTYSWYQAGYLDTNLATTAITTLDPSTWEANVLRFMRVEEGVYAALPSDGWGYVLMYRNDWLSQLDLGIPPVTYDEIRIVARGLHNLEIERYGFCGPSNFLTETSHALEIATVANQTRFVNEAGNLALASLELTEAVDFYTDLLLSYGPVRSLTLNNQALKGYLQGKCGMVFAPPSFLTSLAGLVQADTPTCPECVEDVAYLAKNTGIVNGIRATVDDPIATRGDFLNLGIGLNAKPEALALVDYYFNVAYMDWLSLSPETKWPLRSGTLENPTQFSDAWRLLEVGVDTRAQLATLYPPELLTMLLDTRSNFRRMGLSQVQPRLAIEFERQSDLARAAFAVISERTDVATAIGLFRDRFGKLFPEETTALDVTATPTTQSGG